MGYPMESDSVIKEWLVIAFTFPANSLSVIMRLLGQPSCDVTAGSNETEVTGFCGGAAESSYLQNQVPMRCG
jgi:hypothetical protein